MTNGNDVAYPVDCGEGNFTPGLTKREYIATSMMEGLIASIGQHDVSEFSELADDAVLATDALIAKLNSKGAAKDAAA